MCTCNVCNKLAYLNFKTLCSFIRKHTACYASFYCPYTDTSVMEYITLNETAGVMTESVGHFDDGVSHAIHVAEGFPFGNLQHTFIFVS